MTANDMSFHFGFDCIMF